MVVIDSPEGIAWGGSIAAPVFKSVAEDVLLYMNAPSTNEEKNPYGKRGNDIKGVIRGLNKSNVLGGLERQVKDVTYDSREVRKDSLFVAIPGFKNRRP